MKNWYDNFRAASLAAVAFLLLFHVCGCKSENATKSETQNGSKKAPVQQHNATTQPAERPSANATEEQVSTMPGKGSIAGVLTLPNEKAAGYNIFIYVLDESSATLENPEVLSSLYIPAGSSPGAKSIEFFLNNVAPGQRTVTAVVDAGSPNCAKGSPFCGISLGDFAGQSDPVEVKAGGEPAKVQIGVN